MVPCGEEEVGHVAVGGGMVAPGGVGRGGRVVGVAGGGA